MRGCRSGQTGWKNNISMLFWSCLGPYGKKPSSLVLTQVQILSRAFILKMADIKQSPKSIDELIEQINKGTITKKTILNQRNFEFCGETYSFLDENEQPDLVANIGFLAKLKKKSITYYHFRGSQIEEYRTSIKIG